MKHSLILVIWLASSLAMAQFPSSPYNPDENGDGFIGVVDLQGLLANYGNEFASAVVSEDGESAIVYIDELSYFECEYSCHQLPGFWKLPSPADLVPVYSELHASSSTYTWIDRQYVDGNTWNRLPYYIGNSQLGSRYIGQTETQGYTKKCYCAAKQLPRMEYSYCGGSTIQSCANAKVADGWYPLPGISSHQNGAGSSSGGNQLIYQAFWRWAE